MNTLSLKNVSASYVLENNTANIILNKINLDIEAHDFVVVVGPSGCGKTTLLNLVAGFEVPTEGTITINEKIIKKPGADRGVVFQQNALLPWLTVIENVAFGLKIQGLDSAKRVSISQNFLNLVGLSGFADYHIWQLSGGMKQRVALARALATNPQILLMDEPFGALDAFTKEQMHQLVLNIWQETNKQILLVTHDIEEAIFLSSKLVLMNGHPGEIAKIIPLEFGKRFLKGESVASIKSSLAFIKTKQVILSHFFSDRDEVANELVN
jgi:taurine transport system ATP-binding protein